MNGSLRRSRMVSFRLSPEEYETFQAVCAHHGVRSLSDLARTAMLKMIAKTPSDPLSSEVSTLRSQLSSLSREVDRLSGVIDARASKNKK